jgi:hypothetical protein
VQAEPDRERDRGGERSAPREDRRVRERARGEHRAARDRQRAEPVDDPVLEVLGHRGRGADAAEQDPGGDEPGDEEVDVVDPRDVDRAAEHVAVDQEEQRHLDGREDDQLRRPQVAQQRAAGDGQGAAREACVSRRAAVGCRGDGGHLVPFLVVRPRASAPARLR